MDIFQFESDCVWRVVASMNYADRATMALSPADQQPGPATVGAIKALPRIARRRCAIEPASSEPRRAPLSRAA